MEPKQPNPAMNSVDAGAGESEQEAAVVLGSEGPWHVHEAGTGGDHLVAEAGHVVVEAGDDVGQVAESAAPDAGTVASAAGAALRRGGGDLRQGIADAAHGRERGAADLRAATASSLGAVREAARETMAEATAPVPDPGTDNAGPGTGREWLSMSNDNTAAGLAADVGSGGPISLVVEGMRVYDANGDELGKVDAIKMGDPNAVTAEGEGWEDGANPFDEIGRAIFYGSESPLPESARHNLLRVGYLHVDGKGWLFDRDCFVAADQIARVEGDAVYLTVPKDDLPDA